MKLSHAAAFAAISLFAAAPAMAWAHGVPMHTSSAAQSSRVSSNQVMQLQQALQQHGFYRNGRIDGLMGPKTRTALRDFQRSKGLSATGRVDQQTVAALDLTSQAAARNMAPGAPAAPTNMQTAPAPSNAPTTSAMAGAPAAPPPGGASLAPTNPAPTAPAPSQNATATPGATGNTGTTVTR
jgi:peptidoglycan hydrolase-like protein with peptidoglycan-binding domain